MNEHELHGGVRYVGGKIEKAVGDAVDSRNWQVAGVVDQVAGGAENLYGRAQSVAEDALETAPGVIDHAKERAAEQLKHAAEEARTHAGAATHAVRERAGSAAHAVRGNEGAAIAATAAAAIIGYGLGWLIHGRRA